MKPAEKKPAARILVVDDESGILDICSQVLRRAGFEVSTASNGEEAVGRLHENWDLVLTDLTMPGTVDGNDLVWRTRASGNADVILMTGYPALDTAVQAIKGGAFDYLIKPFSVDTLRSEEHTSELQSLRHLVCRLLLEKKKNIIQIYNIVYLATSKTRVSISIK